ncbi:hypothetical protein ACIQMR_32265 [Streptomyces sp. NPDC091376]|uniref:hypothetical protein n=1 Tax=Streptomyces sp. NPDC091376 TaxID=3365994 RepID=UPI003806CCD3
MPAMLTAAHTASAPRSLVVSVEDLSNLERAVALYASDMPSRFRWRRSENATVSAWIVQGADRLGLAELYRSASYLQGYRLLAMAHLTTTDQDLTHCARFRDERRLDRAEDVASALTCLTGTGMSQSAKDRGSRPLVEGACRCGGSGWIADALDPDDPTTGFHTACPIHNRTGIRTFAWGVAA